MSRKQIRKLRDAFDTVVDLLAHEENAELADIYVKAQKLNRNEGR